MSFFGKVKEVSVGIGKTISAEVEKSRKAKIKRRKRRIVDLRQQLQLEKLEGKLARQRRMNSSALGGLVEDVGFDPVIPTPSRKTIRKIKKKLKQPAIKVPKRKRR